MTIWQSGGAAHLDAGLNRRPGKGKMTVTTDNQTHGEIPGTVIFDGRQAQKGYQLNKMCFSFNREANREAFRQDEEAYCDRYGLTEEQKQAVRDRNALALIAAGGNIYYLAKFAGIFGLTVQDVGAQQRGVTLDEFNTMLKGY